MHLAQVEHALRRLRASLRGRAGAVLAAGLLVAAIGFAYGPAVNNGFVWDDHGYLEFNPALKDFSSLRHAFSTDANRGVSPRMPLSYNYRPVTFASLYLNARLLGATARSFHLGNLVLHALLALILFAFLRRRLEGPRSWALAAALIASCWWALHPEQAETVDWASGRYDLVATLCGVAALALQPWQGPAAVLAQGALLILGVMAKESAFPFFAILAADDWALGRLGRRFVAKYAFLASMFCAWQWLRFHAGSGSMTIRLVTRPLVKTLTDYASALAIYSARAVAPLPLSVTHTYRPIGAVAVAAVLAVLIGLFVALRRKREWLSPLAVWAAMLVAVALVLHSAGSAAERYFYGPSIGLAWLLALAMAKAGSGAHPRVGIALAGVAAMVTAFNFGAVRQRTAQWKSDATLFSSELDDGSEDWFAQKHMAIIEAGLHKLPAALARIVTAREHAVRARANAASIAQILGVEGSIRLQLGDAQTALLRLRDAMRLAPEYPALHLDAAIAHHLLGHEEDEFRELTEALRLSPDYAEARIAMCRLKHSRKDFEGARRELALVPADAAVIPHVARALKDAVNEMETEQ